MSPVGEKLTLIPSFTYNNMMFSEGSFKNRSDKTYNLGLVASLCSIRVVKCYSYV